MSSQRPNTIKVSSSISAQAIILEAARRRASAAVALFDKTPVELSPERWAFYLDRCSKHPKQQTFLRDPGKLLALLCPRRTAKSTSMLFKTMITAETHPGSEIFYVVPDSKGHARRLFWRPLQKMNEVMKLGLQFYEADKRVVHPSGTEISLFGAHDKDAAIQLRGNALSLGMLDECKDFGPHFEEVVVEALLPALGDYGGALVLGGTPGDILAGLFYETTKTYGSPAPEGWSIHHWIKSDNGYLPPEQRDLDHIERTAYRPFGLDRTSPKFRREQLAEWISNDTDRLYLYDAVRNGWDGALPAGHEWMYCMGVDFGERDANAFIVGAFATTCRHMYIVDQYARPKMSIDEIAEKIREYISKYGNFVEIVGDTGGYGRGIVTDLQNRHSLPIVPAGKGKDKLGTIQQMNSDFLSGRIRAQDTTPLVLEWKKLMKTVRPKDFKVILDHTDLGDAALYMWKASLHWASAEKELEPLPGTKEYWAKLEQDAISKAVRGRNGNDFFGTPLSDDRD